MVIFASKTAASASSYISFQNYFISTPHHKKPTIGPKSTAHVGTSSECRQEINVKERKKLEALKLKEKQKAERERRKGRC